MHEPTCEQIVRRGPIIGEGVITWTEQPCGSPATVESGQALCRTHRERQDREAFGSDPDEVETLRRAVGATQELEAMKRYYPGEELYVTDEHKGARVEVIAFRLRDGSPYPIGYPFVYEEFPRIGPCIVARWRFRYPGMPGMLDVRWDRHRKRDERFRRSITLHGLSAAPEVAARLLGLWTTETDKEERKRRRGRNRGDGTRWMSDTEALRDIDEQILKGKYGATALAVALGVDRSAIYRRIQNGARMRLAPYIQQVISRNFAQH